MVLVFRTGNDRDWKSFEIIYKKSLHEWTFKGNSNESSERKENCRESPSLPRQY